jgi:hypothetical protein
MGSARSPTDLPPPAAPPYSTSLSDAARNSVCGPGLGAKITACSFGGDSKSSVSLNWSETGSRFGFSSSPFKACNFFFVAVRLRFAAASRFLRSWTSRSS